MQQNAEKHKCFKYIYMIAKLIKLYQYLGDKHGFINLFLEILNFSELFLKF